MTYSGDREGEVSKRQMIKSVPVFQMTFISQKKIPRTYVHIVLLKGQVLYVKFCHLSSYFRRVDKESKK